MMDRLTNEKLQEWVRAVDAAHQMGGMPAVRALVPQVMAEGGTQLFMHLRFQTKGMYIHQIERSVEEAVRATLKHGVEERNVREAVHNATRGHLRAVSIGNAVVAPGGVGHVVCVKGVLTCEAPQTPSSDVFEHLVTI